MHHKHFIYQHAQIFKLMVFKKMKVVEKRLTLRLSDADEFFFIRDLIYKMLHTNHPKIDLTIISQICVCDS